ncbi:PQQ-dependent sugar dehydrogenase [Aurantibacter crassamenti]|uniref:PQQ-dependent sugar dehydrogenase n=1 Tax=Aurantibacter crassamenti TaxID=1837375 RepID=UPI001EEF466A|nr:PQQ-dependent sugar dehydrogenase [Aurantibacter crassamenti]
MNKLKLFTLLCITGIFLISCNQSAKKTSAETNEQGETAPDSLTLQAMTNYENLCSSCHGSNILSFAGHRWKHGKVGDSIFKSIKHGYEGTEMIAWENVLSDDQITNLTNYILKEIENVERYGVQEEQGLVSDTIQTELLTIKLDTIVSGMVQPWGMVFLPSGDLLVTEQSGELYRVDKTSKKIPVTGLPKSKYRGQGGLLDLELHPDFENNNWLYVSYSDYVVKGKDTLAGTALSRFKFANDKLTNEEKLFEGHPYSDAGSHFAGRIEFDNDGYLFLSVGDRRKENENPQFLTNYNGKIHRMMDDGKIPSDNPFVGQDSVMQTIYSYGHRNPQGLALNPETNKIWAHEHGPRGGDEVNIIEPGNNYGWPVISYGIEYDGTRFTQLEEKEGMEQPILYWVPSIAPCGAAFVTTDKYPGWEGDFLAGSLRFKYLNRCIVEGNKIVREEPLFKGIGRVRNVRVGPDGYIYVAVEEPGYIFRLMPI